jgi:hypothetical protein
MEVHPDIEAFWKSQRIRYISTESSDRRWIEIDDKGWFVRYLAWELRNGRIEYLLGNGCYYEKEMLRSIKLKAFL